MLVMYVVSLPMCVNVVHLCLFSGGFCSLFLLKCYVCGGTVGRSYCGGCFG